MASNLTEDGNETVTPWLKALAGLERVFIRPPEAAVAARRAGTSPLTLLTEPIAMEHRNRLCQEFCLRGSGGEHEKTCVYPSGHVAMSLCKAMWALRLWRNSHMASGHVTFGSVGPPSPSGVVAETGATSLVTNLCSAPASGAGVKTGQPLNACLASGGWAILKMWGTCSPSM